MVSSSQAAGAAKRRELQLAGALQLRSTGGIQLQCKRSISRWHGALAEGCIVLSPLTSACRPGHHARAGVAQPDGAVAAGELQQLLCSTLLACPSAGLSCMCSARALHYLPAQVQQQKAAALAATWADRPPRRFCIPCHRTPATPHHKPYPPFPCPPAPLPLCAAEGGEGGGGLLQAAADPGHPHQRGRAELPDAGGGAAAAGGDRDGRQVGPGEHHQGVVL